MATIEQRALNHIWFPCSQMKDYQDFPPLAVSHAVGSYLHLLNGDTLIDAISSWWCKSLGHGHPRLKAALVNQLERCEHVMGANMTHPALVELSERLSQLCAGLDKVFYAGDGSCAVEIAMKMSLHSRTIQNQTKRTQFITLENSYHGETLACLSVSDVGLYKAPYASHTFDCITLGPLPYVLSQNDPLWDDCSSYWPAIEAQLLTAAQFTTAIIIEPLLQGAGGMKLYSQDFLKRLTAFAKAHDIHLIADEIMTGIGRAGRMLAVDYANVEPDFICLSKGLCSGFMAFSAVLTSSSMYDIFYDDYDSGKAFLHSHTYGGNALAASIALETLRIIEEEHIIDQANRLGSHMLDKFNQLKDETSCITNVRQMGAMVAGELTLNTKRAGFEVFKVAVKRGALLRPLGNTLYWLPPLNTAHQTIDELSEISLQAIETVKKASG